MTTPDLPPPTLDELSKMLSRAFSLGQTYWQQADSESYSQNRKSDATLEKFRVMQDGFLPTILAYGDARAAAAVLAERERCAMKCESEHVGESVNDDRLVSGDMAYNTALRHAAAAIRRAEQEPQP